MTRRDYQLIAKALRKAKPENHDPDERRGWIAAVHRIAEVLTTSRSNFDAVKFLEAATGEKGKKNADS